MSTGTTPGSPSHRELLNEIERLKDEVQVLEADLSKHKHISHRAIHYKHETRRRTIQRNLLALVVALLAAWLFYLHSAKPVPSEIQPEQEEVPNTHMRALAPDAENGESSGEE